MISPAPRVFHNVPSPFCGIAADDLTLRVDGLRVEVLENGDAVTRAGFEAPLGATTPRIAGRPASLDEAVQRAAELLGAARLPLFSGFGTDVSDTRAALSLVDLSRGVFDQARAAASLRNLSVVQDSGWMATTLGEVRNRVEVLVAFGTDIEAAFPRFFERYIWVDQTLFGQRAAGREIVFIGPAPRGTAAVAPDGRAPRIIPCAKDALPDVAAAFNALSRGVELRCSEVGGVPVAELAALVERLRQSSYSVVTWAAAQLDFPHAELTVQQITQAVVALNRTTRAAALPLGGQEGERTASQVCAWLSGYPTRVAYLKGYPEHDPVHFSADHLLGSGEADVLVWVSSLSLAPPPVTAIPTVVIGRSGMELAVEPEVYIPVGCPGLDHAGHMYRCDNVVALPLYGLRESGLPSAQAVLQAIEACLAAPPG